MKTLAEPSREVVTTFRIGVDPGLSGALVLIDHEKKFIEVFDVPTMASTKKRNKVNCPEVAKIVERWRRKYEGSLTAYIEDVHAMPKQGTSSMFSFGRSFGNLEMALAYAMIPTVYVPATSWKKRAGLRGKEKDTARALAQQLFPTADLARKKDIGRAEALLIAYFGGEK